ncbi:MAG: PepSY domain-containing protein [Thiohalomonadales bacterium]
MCTIYRLEKSDRLAVLKRNYMLAILCATLVTAFAHASDDDDDPGQDRARELSQQGIILSLPIIIEKAQLIHPGKILEVEFKQAARIFRYEIELLDDKGTVWEMEFDAQTGKLIKLEQDD